MNYDSSTPIYIQVIEEIKKDIVSGKRALGEKLPSTRELAVEMSINANTAARIYKELELLGIAFTKRGIGTFVTESQEAYKAMKKDLSEKYIKLFIKNMMDLGYSEDEIIKLVKEFDLKEV